MAFESGSASFRVFHLCRQLPPDYIERFAKHAAQPCAMVGELEQRGWVTGRHLLDRSITEDRAKRGSYTCLALQEAQRKIPAALLKAECRMEELACMDAEGRPFLNKQEKADIREQVRERLSASTPVSVKGINMVYRPGEDLLADCLSARDCDVFTAHLLKTQEVNAFPITAVFYPYLIDMDSRDLKATSFSPRMADELMDVDIGRDFLTWLWYYSEACGGVCSLGGNPVSIMIEGPLLFAHNGDGALETLLRKGATTASAEAKACLLAGKKLKRASIVLALGEVQWRVNLDADEFIFRSVKLPKIEEYLDDQSHFEERMKRIKTLTGYMFSLYKRFLYGRSSPVVWAEEKPKIYEWVENKPVRD